MTIGCNIWMIYLKLIWFFYDPSCLLQLSEFLWTLPSSTWVVFNNFLLIDATDRNKISSDQKRLFFIVSLNPLWFFANTPFKYGWACAMNNISNAEQVANNISRVKKNINICCLFQFPAIPLYKAKEHGANQKVRIHYSSVPLVQGAL